MTTDTDARLRELALAALPGPWRWHGFHELRRLNSPHGIHIAGISETDRAYLQAIDPTTLLALLDAKAAAEKRAHDEGASAYLKQKHIEHADKRIEVLERELARAREALRKLFDAADNLTTMWRNQKVAGLPRAERNASIEQFRDALIIEVEYARAALSGAADGEAGA